MPHNRAVLLVSGMIAADPYQGGATWAVLQYLLGFRRLGYDVVFVESCPSSPGSQPPETAQEGPKDQGQKTKDYFGKVVRAFGLAGRAALLRAGTRETVG